MRPVIDSEKRIVQITLSAVTGFAQASVNIVDAKQSITATDPREVSIGTVVKAVYLELWLLGSGQQPNTSSVWFYKLPSGTGVPTAGQLADMNGWDNKNNILEAHMGLVGDANTNPTPFFRGWIKIPKGKQRMSIGDKIGFSILAITEDVQFCGIAIYKRYN